VHILHSVGDEPLFTSLSLCTTHVSEGADGTHAKSLCRSEDDGFHDSADLLVDARKVSSRLSDEPLFTSSAQNAIARGHLTTSPETKSLTRLDNGCANDIYHLNFNARDVGSGTTEQPLITSMALNTLLSVRVVIDKIAKSTKTECCVGSNNLKRSYTTRELLTGIKREGLLLKTVLLITPTNEGLAISINSDLTILSSTSNWVSDHAVVTRGNHDHSLRSSNKFLVFLTSDGCRSYHYTGHIRIVIKNVNIMIRSNTNNSVHLLYFFFNN